MSKTQLVTLIYGPFQQRTTERLENKGPCKQVTKNFQIQKGPSQLNSFNFAGNSKRGKRLERGLKKSSRSLAATIEVELWYSTMKKLCFILNYFIFLFKIIAIDSY